MSKIVDKVVFKLKSRQELGLIKYGVSMDREDLSTEQWLEHLQEELLDGACYIEKILNTNEQYQLEIRAADMPAKVQQEIERLTAEKCAEIDRLRERERSAAVWLRNVQDHYAQALWFTADELHAMKEWLARMTQREDKNDE